MTNRLTSLFNRRQAAGFATLACTVLFTITLPVQAADFNSLANKPFTSATAAPYLADPTGHNDSTNAIQNCSNDAATNRGACVLPPGTYMIGSQNAAPPWAGLTMPSQSSLLGFQNLVLRHFDNVPLRPR
jgi:hypothetical protein